MQNFVHDGERVTIAAPYTVAGGQGVVVGTDGFFGLAFGDAQVGENVTVSLEGVFDISKSSASVFALGEAVGFDVTTLKCVESASGSDVTVGWCVQAAGAGAATVRVRLAPTVV